MIVKKRNNKGFTLIELLAVFVILAIIMGIATLAYSQYIRESKKKAYTIAEESLQVAAGNALTQCMTNPTDEFLTFCDVHKPPKNQFEHDIISGEDLVRYNYIDEIADPYNPGKYCDMEKSYVYISNRANTENATGEDYLNNYDFVYKVCLVCGDRKSEDCDNGILGEELNPSNPSNPTPGSPDGPNGSGGVGSSSTGDFTSVCQIFYDEAGNEPYDNVWTNRPLYLKLSTTGTNTYGIDPFEYKIVGESSWTTVRATDNQAVVKITQPMNNKEIVVRAYDGLNRVSNNQATCVGKNGNKLLYDPSELKSVKLTATQGGKPIASDVWANKDVLLTATVDPTSTISGYLYEWHKIENGTDTVVKSWSNSATYTATTNATYYVKVKKNIANTVTELTIAKSNEYIVKIDKKKPQVTVLESSIGLNVGENYPTQNNLSSPVFGIAGGTLTCNPANNSTLGSDEYTINCIARGNNGLSTKVSYILKHSYPATPTCPNGGTYNSSTKKCDYTKNVTVCGCQTYNSCRHSSCGSESYCNGNTYTGECCKAGQDCNCYIDYIGGSSACYGICGVNTSDPQYDPSHCCTVCGDGESEPCTQCDGSWETRYQSCVNSSCSCSVGKSCSVTPTYICPEAGSTLGDGSTKKPDKTICYY